METENLVTIDESIKGPITSAEIAEVERILSELRERQDIHLHGNRLYSEIQRIIGETDGQAGALIRVLQKIQNMIGYLPTPVIKAVSREMKVPLSEIYGIVSFYHFFTLTPKGKYVIQVCLGTSCYVKGGQVILDALKKEINLLPGGITSDGKFSLEIVRCLGACGLSPVMAIGNDIHGRVKPSKLNDILGSYR